MSKTSQALSNLRAVVIIVVLAFHSFLAYLDFLPEKPYAFAEPPWKWQAFPIIDSARFLPLDLFCAWQDVCLMSLMYFLSGLFVWPSLVRKGSGAFLTDRLLRIGLPMIVVILVLMPIAYYPTYLVSAADPGVAAYWRAWQALGFWPCGPQWFLWQLLAMGALAAGLYKVWPRFGEHLGRMASGARERPDRFLAGLAVASAIAYVPLSLAFTPWDWGHLGPMAVQLCRPLHYGVYFFAGVAIGAHGLERGLLAIDGRLAQRWKVWLAGAVVAFFGLWMAPTALIVGDEANAPVALQVAAELGFVLACASGCLAFTGLFVRFWHAPSRVLDSLSESAYGMYLVHYVFVVWLQFALLGVALPAVVKAAIVLAGTLVMSWTATAAVCALPTGARLIGAKR